MAKAAQWSLLIQHVRSAGFAGRFFIPVYDAMFFDEAGFSALHPLLTLQGHDDF